MIYPLVVVGLSRGESLYEDLRESMEVMAYWRGVSQEAKNLALEAALIVDGVGMDDPRRINIWCDEHALQEYEKALR